MANADAERRAWLLAAAAAVAVGAGLRLFALTAGSLWIDEFMTAWVTSAPDFSGMLKRCLSQTTHSPLYFTIARLSTQNFGVNELGLRLPSAAFGIAALPMMFLLVRRLWRRDDIAAAATWLLAVDRDHIAYSYDGRPYALCILLALVSLWAFVKAVREGRTGWLVATAVTNLVLTYAHYPFALLAVAQTALVCGRYALGRFDGRPLTIWLGLQLGCVVAMLPVAPQVLRLVQQRVQLTTSGAPRPFVVADGFLGPDLPRKLVGVALVFLAVALWRREPIGWDAVPGPDGRVDLPVAIVLAWYFVPATCQYAVSRAGGVDLFYQLRLICIYQVAGLVFAAWLLGGLRPRRTAIVAVAVVLALSVGYQHRPSKLRAMQGEEDWRGALRLVDGRIQPQDLLLVRSGLVEAVDADILADPLGRESLCAPLYGPYVKSDATPLPLPFFWEPSAMKEYVEQMLLPALREAETVWLVTRTRKLRFRFPWRFERWLQRELPGRFEAVEYHPFDNVDVRLYRRVAPTSQPG